VTKLTVCEHRKSEKDKEESKKFSKVCVAETLVNETLAFQPFFCLKALKATFLKSTNFQLKFSQSINFHYKDILQLFGIITYSRYDPHFTTTQSSKHRRSCERKTPYLVVALPGKNVTVTDRYVKLYLILSSYESCPSGVFQNESVLEK
jgi:hypothetical protein